MYRRYRVYVDKTNRPICQTPKINNQLEDLVVDVKIK